MFVRPKCAGKMLSARCKAVQWFYVIVGMSVLDPPICGVRRIRIPTTYDAPEQYVACEVTISGPSGAKITNPETRPLKASEKIGDSA